MNPFTRVFMAVLCVYCTVSAQKPGTASGGGGVGSNAPPAAAPQQNVKNAPSAVANDGESCGSNTPPMTLQQQNSESALSSFLNGNTLQQDAPAKTRVAPQVASLSATSEPSRVVFQSTPASDPRTTAAFGGELGWGMPSAIPATPKLDVLSFDSDGTNTPQPVCFADTASVAVQTLILATRGDAVALATLVDATGTARLRIAETEGQGLEMSGAERSLTEQFRQGQWQSVWIDFEAPTNLSGLFFGGSAGRPEWSRNWRGEIAEIVGFNVPPDADLRAGVANYLAIRWGFGGHPATPEQREAAIAAGLHYGLVWGSVIILK